ncbi:MAG: methyltransferase [Pseudomonadota bacterium]
MSDDPLAEAYERGLAHEKAGRAEEAAAAYRQALALDANDPGGVALRLAALGHGAAPDKAPPAYVATLFDQHAEVFDLILVDQLEYGVPMLIRERLQTHALGPFANMLDLGCGTGLAAIAVEDMCERFTGVDLAEGMIEVADEKEIFNDLFIADAVNFLDGTEGTYDLIIAADVLPYLGDAAPLFRGVAARLNPGGVFAFSTETRQMEEDWRIIPSHRYAHALPYIERQIAKAGLKMLEALEINVREEEGEPSPGHLILATA